MKLFSEFLFVNMLYFCLLRRINYVIQCRCIYAAIPRKLNEAEMAQLAKHDSRPVSSLKRFQLEKEASRSWDRFYKRNTDKFFKDRHWTIKEFSDLAQVPSVANSIKVLEIGCGVGNFAFPLLEDNPSMYIYACDFSPTAISLLKVCLICVRYVFRFSNEFGLEVRTRKSRSKFGQALLYVAGEPSVCSRQMFSFCSGYYPR